MNQALIKTNDFIRDPGNLVMRATATFVATVSGPFTLHYSINPAAIVTTPVNSRQFCSNCYYDILVEVKDECGAVLNTATSAPFNGTDIDVTCNPNPLVITNDLEFTVAKIGEYTIT